MNASAQNLWDRVYDYAATTYTQIPKYYDADARLTANAAVRGWYSGGRLRRLTGLARTPKFGNLLNLTPYTRGGFESLEIVDPTGTIAMVAFQNERHDLLWSKRLQAAFVFPAMTIGACSYPPRPTEDTLARMWAKGRPARCSARASLSSLPPLPFASVGIQVTYRSDKFTHGRMKRYIHHFGPGVRIYFSDAPDASRPPRVIMIRGGALRLTKHGIDG